MKKAVDGARACVECEVCETRCSWDLTIRAPLNASVAFFDRLAAEQ